MNYYSVKCPGCNQWVTGSTKKRIKDATFNCRLCNKSKRFYNWKIGYIPSPTNLEVAYFGNDVSKATEVNIAKKRRM
jgi:dolichyl-phosphate-mannose--protein O-mannosyl transferase